MRHITYTCNLCRGERDEEDVRAIVRTLGGIESIELQVPDNPSSNVHICQDCVKAIIKSGELK